MNKKDIYSEMIMNYSEESNFRCGLTSIQINSKQVQLTEWKSPT